jgi:hypothetical protein
VDSWPKQWDVAHVTSAVVPGSLRKLQQLPQQQSLKRKHTNSPSPLQDLLQTGLAPAQVLQQLQLVHQLMAQPRKWCLVSPALPLAKSICRLPKQGMMLLGNLWSCSCVVTSVKVRQVAMNAPNAMAQLKLLKRSKSSRSLNPH